MDLDALIAAARKRLHERINRIVGQKLRRMDEKASAPSPRKPRSRA